MLPGHHAGIATTGRVWWLRKVRGLSAALPLYRAAATGREWRHYFNRTTKPTRDTMTKKTKTDQRPATVCRLCGRRCGRDVCYYTRGTMITCENCERDAGFSVKPEITFNPNPIRNQRATELREEIESCEYWIERKLGGVVNHLRSLFPGAPDRLLWQVVLHDPHYGDMGRHQLKHIAKLRRRLKRLKEKRRLARSVGKPK
jgi:hypothetical protein